MPVSLPHPSHAFSTLAPGSDADSNAASFPAAGGSVSGIVKGRRAPHVVSPRFIASSEVSLALIPALMR